jgi:hypothetical protein
MKKLIVLTLTVIMVLSLVAPGIALADSIPGDTSVEINVGENVPIVKAKWEQLKCDPYDDDPTTPGLQVYPPLVAGAMRAIEYYAVVTHEAGVANIQRVDADVYHPVGSPEPYGPSVEGGVIPAPYFKYEIPMTYLCTGDQAEQMLQSAYDMGLVKFADPPYNLAEVLGELDKGTAEIWVGCAPIDYEQPAGDYRVAVFAADAVQMSAPLENYWTYVPMCGVEVDFIGIDFGPTNLNVEKMIAGDTIWNNPKGINNATVRNVGNTWTSVTVEFNDMDFGHLIDGTWNVQFDARMGSDPYYYEGDIMPYEMRPLRNYLNLSCKDELDFSIKVLKGTGQHDGTITIGCVEVPFDAADQADALVSIDARGDYDPMPNPCLEPCSPE